MKLLDFVSIRALAIALVLGGAPPAVARAAEPLEIPAMLPMTGTAAFLGKSEADSLHALEMSVNKRGGINGRDVHFAIVDNAGNPQLGVQLLNAALAKKPLAVVDGGPLSTCRASAAIVAAAGPVLYCFSPSIHPAAGRYVFSGLNSSQDILGVSLKYLRERGLKKIAVINATDATGQDGDDVINALMKAPENVRAGMTIADYEHFNLTDLSVSAQMSRIKAAGPQAIIAFVSGTPIATVLHAVQDSGLEDIPIITSTANGTYEQMESLKSIMPKELLFAGPPLLVPSDVTDASVKRAIAAFNDAFAGAQRGDLLHGVAWDVASLLVTGLQQRHIESSSDSASLNRIDARLRRRIGKIQFSGCTAARTNDEFIDYGALDAGTRRLGRREQARRKPQVTAMSSSGRHSPIAPNTRFLRNTWYPVLWSTDLVGEAMVPRTVLNEPLVFFRDTDGKPSALVDVCPHRFAPLHLGKRLPGGGIRCGYHGLEFASSGECIGNPHGDGRIPAGARVHAYPVVEKHRILWLWMGDGVAAPEQIPDFRIFDNPAEGTLTKFDSIELAANYELITDNLMDLSHTAFLHEGLLGNEDTRKAVPEVVQDGNTVTVSRTHPNIRPFKIWDLTYRDDNEPIDFWDSMRWDPPGCFLLDTFATRAGSPRSEGAGFYAVHLLTPETETSTHYMFSGVRYNVENARLPTPELVAEIGDLRRHIFTSQDGMMIGAQQHVLKQFPDFTVRPALFSIDAGPARYKRVLNALIDAEGA